MVEKQRGDFWVFCAAPAPSLGRGVAVTAVLGTNYTCDLVNEGAGVTPKNLLYFCLYFFETKRSTQEWVD